MRAPKPVISEYYVRRIKHHIDQETGRVFISWATNSVEVVNTVDIESTLHQDNTFLVGWLEMHYEEEQRQSHGTIIPAFKEVFLKQDHPFNLDLVRHLSESVQEALKSPDIRGIPKIRSYERMLFSLGWKFKMNPVGDSDEAWSAFDIPFDIIKKFPEQAEIKLLEGKRIPQVAESNNAFTQAAIPLTQPQELDPGIENRVSALEYGLGSVNDKLNQILEFLTNGQTNPSVGRSESRTPGFGGEAGPSRVNHEVQGSPNYVLSQPGAPADQLQGVVPVGPPIRFPDYGGRDQFVYPDSE